MKILFPVFFMFISLSTYSIDTVSSKYFPLRTGNKWFFYVTKLGYPQPTYSIKTLRIYNDTLLNGKRYFKTIGYPFSYNDTGKVFIRYDSVNGLLKKYCLGCFNCNYENTMFKLSANLGDTTGTCAEIQFSCVQIKDTFLFNQTTTMKKFYFYFSNGHNFYNQDYTFLKNIGILYDSRTSSGNAGIYGDIGNLRGCIINGIVYGDTSSTIGINIISHSIPGSYSFSQNFPNPFNPATKIQFSVPLIEGSRGRVSLKIYDALGREIETLVNEELKPGVYEVDWDASQFTSGVYFYRLIVDGFTESKKMLLIK